MSAFTSINKGKELSNVSQPQQALGQTTIPSAEASGAQESRISHAMSFSNILHAPEAGVAPSASTARVAASPAPEEQSGTSAHQTPDAEMPDAEKADPPSPATTAGSPSWASPSALMTLAAAAQEVSNPSGAQTAYPSPKDADTVMRSPSLSAPPDSPREGSPPPAEDESMPLPGPAQYTIPATEAEHRDFECANDPFNRCYTGQYTLTLSRKCISDHFGRNKASTRAITFWPILCRKHYQRHTYHKGKWQAEKSDLIKEQFKHIDAQVPGVLYDVQLKKGEAERYSTFTIDCAKNHISTEAAIEAAAENADAELAARPRNKNKTYEAPMMVLRALSLGDHLGKNKTKDEVVATVDFMRGLVDSEQSKELPIVEFLPQMPGTGGKKGKAAVKSRVSKKGAVQKP